MDLLSAKICTAVKIKNDLIACIKDIEDQLQLQTPTLQRPQDRYAIESLEALQEKDPQPAFDRSPRQVLRTQQCLSPQPLKPLEKKLSLGHRRPLQRLSMSTLVANNMKSPTLASGQINQSQHKKIIEDLKIINKSQASNL